MKKRMSLLFALALTVSVIAVPLSAGAAGDPPVPRLGDQINLLFGTPATFAAGEPFHVTHGFGVGGADPSISEISKYDFDLFVDGKQMHGAKTLVLDGTEWEVIRWVINFRHGLEAGPHVIKGVWTAPDEPEFVREHTIDFTE